MRTEHEIHIMLSSSIFFTTDRCEGPDPEHHRGGLCAFRDGLIGDVLQFRRTESRSQTLMDEGSVQKEEKIEKSGLSLENRARSHRNTQSTLCSG